MILKDVDYSDPEELATCCFKNHTHVKSSEGTLFKWLEDHEDVYGSMGGSTPTWLEAHLSALNGMGLDASGPAVFYGYLSATIGTTPYAGSITCADGNLLKDGGDCTGGIDVSEFTLMYAIEDDTIKVSHSFNFYFAYAYKLYRKARPDDMVEAPTTCTSSTTGAQGRTPIEQSTVTPALPYPSNPPPP